MTDDAALKQKKQFARKMQQQLRQKLSLNTHITSQQLCEFAENIMALTPNKNSVIALFIPFGSEIDVLPLAKKLLKIGAKICMPVVVEKNAPLIFRQWHDGCNLVKDHVDMAVPDDIYPIMKPDIIMVPLLGFDDKGWRLGYGGGFYDRTLAMHDKVISIGVGYAKQKMNYVPKGLHDKPVDYILTENNLTKI